MDTLARNESAVVAPSASPAVASRRFDYLPVALFGSVMGLTGLSIGWRLAAVMFDFTQAVADIVAAIAIVAFIVMTIAYAIKFVTARDAVAAEFHHPIAGNLFGTICISLLLLPLLLAPMSLALARAVWSLGAVSMMLFAWLIVDRWLNDRQQPAHATPAWIIPVVGLLDIPLAMPVLDWPMLHPLSVLATSVGLFFAVPLFTLIFSRLIFEPPLPDALRPSLMILVAPFAVGTSAYVATTGSFDRFAAALVAIALFLMPLLMLRLRTLMVCCPFRVSWWAVSFPLAAVAIATLRMAGAHPSPASSGLAGVMLGTATVVIVYLLGRTVLGIARGEMRTLSS